MDEASTSWQSGMLELLDGTLRWTPKLVAGLVLFAGGLWLAGFAAASLERQLARRRVDAELSMFLVRVTRISLLSLTTVVALQQVDFDLTGFVAGLGIMGVTVGFALQDVAKNFVAGLLLLIQQPFEIGDGIEVSGQAGVVEDIQLRATLVRTFDGLRVWIPNADVYTKVVRVFWRRGLRRQSIVVTVAVEELAQAHDALRSTLARRSLHEPTPRLLTRRIDAEHATVVCWFWLSLGKDGAVDQLDAVIRALHDGFTERGVGYTSLEVEALAPDAVGVSNPA